MRKLFVLLFLLVTLNNYTNICAADVRLISVAGIATTSVQPNMALIDVSLWSKSSSAKLAQSNSAMQNELLKKSLDAFKIKKEDVKTSSYNLNPEYEYDQKTKKNIIIGYSAVQSLRIILRKIDQTGDFVDSLSSDSKSLASGISINSLHFDLDKKNEADNALLEDAVKDAENKAHVLAKAARVKLGGIYRLSPKGLNNIPQMYDGTAMMESRSSKNFQPTSFMSGEILLTKEVTAEYLVE
jgi:hypothetical protein